MSGPPRARAVRRAGEDLGRRSQPRGVVATPSYRHCLVTCGTSHEAEDLLQSALVTACVRWGAIRDKGAADPYVRRTVLNRRRGALRRGRGRCGGTTTELASPAPAEAATSQAAGVAAPLSYLRDGRLHVLDPQGVDHELGLDVEAVLGSTESATSAGSTPSTATRGPRARPWSPRTATWCSTAMAGRWSCRPPPTATDGRRQRAASWWARCPGSGYLSPYGDRVASLVLRPGGAARALLWTPSGAVVERATWGGGGAGPAAADCRWRGRASPSRDDRCRA